MELHNLPDQVWEAAAAAFFFFFKWMTISLFVIEGRRGALRITIEKDDS